MVLAHVSTGPLRGVVACGVHCLELFVQLNWTGPPAEDFQTDLEALVGSDAVLMLNQQALQALGSDGEVSQLSGRERGYHSLLLITGCVQTMYYASSPAYL